MKITYDKEADALYIRLLEGEYESRVRERESGGGKVRDREQQKGRNSKRVGILTFGPFSLSE